MTRVDSRSSISARQIIRNVVFNGASIVLPMLIAVFAIPLIIHLMGVARFGLLSLCWVLIGYSGLFDFGLSRALTKLVAERLGTSDEDDLPSLIFTAISLMTVCGIMCGGLLAIIGPPSIGRFIRVPGELISEAQASILIIAVALPIVVTTAGLRGVIEGAHRFDFAGILRTALGVFNFLSPLLVLPFSKSLTATILTLLLGRVGIFVAHIHFCLKIVPNLRKRLYFNRQLIRPLINFGAPSTVSSIAAPLMMALDRIIVGARVSVSAIAFYASPYEITARLGLIPNSIVGVLFPAFSAASIRSEVQTSALFIRAARTMMVVMFCSSLALIVFAEAGLRIWLGTQFAENSTAVLQLLSVAIFANSFGLLAFTLIQGTGYPGLCAKVNLFELILYIPLLWFGTKAYGIVGTAAIALGRVFFDSTVLLLISARIVPIMRKSVGESLLMMYGGVLILFVAMMSKGRPTALYIFVFSVIACAIFGWHHVVPRQDRDAMWSRCRDLCLGTKP